VKSTKSSPFVVDSNISVLLIKLVTYKTPFLIKEAIISEPCTFALFILNVKLNVLSKSYPYKLKIIIEIYILTSISYLDIKLGWSHHDHMS